MNDPEFMALNPGLSQISQESGAALLSLSNDSDVIEQLTEWIAQDPTAMDFVSGKPDPWGMKVNPAYKKIKLPRSEWPLLDAFVPTTNNVCRQHNPAVYFTQLAAPVTALRKIAEALLDGWPNVQTRCDADSPRAAGSSGASTGSPTAPGSCSGWSVWVTPPATGCAPQHCRPRRAPTWCPTTTRSPRPST